MNDETQLTVPGPRPGMPFTSPSVAQVCAALAIAQGKFRAPKRTKTATVRPRDGGAGYTFSYAPLEEIIDAVKDALAEAGLARFQSLIHSPDGDYVRTVIWHASGEFLSGDYPVMYSKEGAQAYAGGVTYAKRNGLAMVLGLAPEDDDDANVAEGNTATISAKTVHKPNPPAPNPMQDTSEDTGLSDVDLHDHALAAAAEHGMERLRKAWDAVPQNLKSKLKAALERRHKIVAEAVDASTTSMGAPS